MMCTLSAQGGLGAKGKGDDEMKKGRFFCLILSLLLACLIVLPGCVTFSIGTEINSDLSGKRVYDVAVDESFASLLEASKEKGEDVETQMKKGAPEGSKYKTFKKGGKVHYEVSFPFSNLEDLKSKIAKMSGSSKEGQSPKSTVASLEKKDMLVFATYTFEENFPAAPKTKESKQFEQFAKAFSVTCKVKMPGSITSASGGQIKGDTATWSFNLTDGKKIKVTSRYVRWWLIIVVIAVSLGLLLAIVIGALFLRKPKARPRPNSTNQTPTA